MALRTNSKQAMMNLYEYIKQDMDYLVERADFDNIKIDINDCKQVATFIYKIYQEEKPDSDQVMYHCRIREQEEFEAWAKGLPLGVMFNYYYQTVAKDIVGEVLEETEEEKGKYTETQAEDLLTYMIYRWIKRNAE